MLVRRKPFRDYSRSAGLREVIGSTGTRAQQFYPGGCPITQHSLLTHPVSWRGYCRAEQQVISRRDRRAVRLCMSGFPLWPYFDALDPAGIREWI
jgi:hypothetical protein